jgi:hypothetical protein
MGPILAIPEIAMHWLSGADRAASEGLNRAAEKYIEWATDEIREANPELWSLAPTGDFVPRVG